MNRSLVAQAILSGILVIDAKERSCMRLLRSAEMAAMTGANDAGGIVVVVAAVTLAMFLGSYFCFLFHIQGACPSIPPPFWQQ